MTTFQLTESELGTRCMHDTCDCECGGLLSCVHLIDMLAALFDVAAFLCCLNILSNK